MCNRLISRLFFCILSGHGWFLAGFLVAERFISFDFPWFIFRVFGCGNKLLSWPKTNCVVDVLLAGTIVPLWALPLKGINWQPHTTHPLFIGVNLYCMLYCISVSYHSRRGHIVFVPRVVFLPPTLPVSVFLRDRVGGREVYFFWFSLIYISCLRMWK